MSYLFSEFFNNVSPKFSQFFAFREAPDMHNIANP